MKEVGQKVNTFEDWKREMLEVAQKAVADNRLMNAAFFCRAAEFYILQEGADKELAYNKFSELFYKFLK